MKKIISSLLLLLFVTVSNAQNANYVVYPYAEPFQYGINPGWWGPQFTNPQIGQLAVNAGVKAVRVWFPDYYVTPGGGNIFSSDIAGYTADGLNMGTGMVAFLSGVDPSNQLDSTFAGCDHISYIWRGLYKPIWTDSAAGIIDTANTWGNYVYKIVNGAGTSVKFWELINEMDFTYNTADAGGNSFNVTLNKESGTSWWNVPPAANDLQNLKAPIFYYIRMMQVAYSVIKKLQPSEYVCIGGIGYPATLDALMRYTPNPVDGSLTTDWPLTGGAFFDIVNFHTYPMYAENQWSNGCSCFQHFRYSDFMIDQDTEYVHQYDSVQNVHGYNGSTYPKKLYISTETDVPQDSLDDSQWGSIQSAINYTIKWNVLCQTLKNPLIELDKYGLGSEPLDEHGSEFNHCGLYGDITEDTCTVQYAIKTEEWYGYKTMSDALYSKKYDSARTAAMDIPSNIRGFAFKDSAGNYTYCMWAKTKTDLSEGASATYTFPFGFSGTRKEWDNSQTNSSTTSTSTVTLGGNPSFFTQRQIVLSLPDTIAIAGGIERVSKPDIEVSHNNEFIIVEAKQSGNYFLIDMQKRELAKGTYYTGQTQIDISRLASGIYILEALQNDKMNVFKIIKE